MAETTGGDMTAAFTSALETAFTDTPAGDASPAPEPAQETPTADAPAPAAITQAAAETLSAESASADNKPPGEPPVWRWQDILENARKEHDLKGYERAKQEYEQQYGELTRLSPEERAGLQIWNRALRGDRDTIAMLRARPEVAAQIQAMFGLGASPEPTAPEPEPQPDAAIQLADGSQVPVFTPDGMKRREAWLHKQLETSLSEKFKPLAQTAEQLRQQQAQAEAQQQTAQWAQRVLNPIKKLPYFEEFKPGIQKALAELPPNFSGDLEDVVVSAYTALHTAKLAELTKTGEAKALANLQQRAVAGTPNPNAAKASTPKKFAATPEGFAEALAYHQGT